MSALTQPDGNSAKILGWWREGRVVLVASESTLREAELVLGAGWLARVVSPEPIEQLLAELREKATIVGTTEVPALRLKDRGDRDLVAAAVAGGARYVVTADREVLLKRGYDDVEFITSGEFVERMTGDS